VEGGGPWPPDPHPATAACRRRWRGRRPVAPSLVSLQGPREVRRLLPNGTGGKVPIELSLLGAVASIPR
jgi:hypothetical protein